MNERSSNDTALILERLAAEALLVWLRPERVSVSMADCGVLPTLPQCVHGINEPAKGIATFALAPVIYCSL